MLVMTLCKYVSKYKFLNAHNIKKYVESEARVTSLVLIEGIAEVKRL